MSEDRMRAGQRIVPRFPGTGGDAAPDDVEGHRVDDAPEGAGPVQRVPSRAKTDDEQDVEGHRRAPFTSPDEEGETSAVRLPTSGGEFIAKLPPDSPHREG